VAYRWLHGDGSKSNIKTFKVRGKGTKVFTVREKATFRSDVEGWQALQVLAPRKVTTKRTYFSVTCERPETPEPQSVRAWVKVEPERYEGACTAWDPKIGLTGYIKVARPDWVRYRWIINGEIVDYGKTKIYDSEKVFYAFKPGKSVKGWAALEILSPKYAHSNKAYFNVECKEAAKASIESLNVSTDSTRCPDAAKVSGAATIAATGATRVKFSWVLNGQVVNNDYLDFSSAGTRNITLNQDLRGDLTKGGALKLVIDTPNGVAAERSFAAPCAVTAPPAAS
jgi:hypothetical protein